jgi:hypothetical protein
MRVLITSSLLLTALANSAPAQETHTSARICIGPTTVETSPSSADAAASAVRATFSSFLNGPSVRVSLLESRLLSQARLEAKTASCQYLLLTSIKHEHKSGRSFFQRVAGAAVQQSAFSIGAGVASGTGLIGAAAAGALGAAASEYANTTRSRDELSLVTRLESAEGRVLFEQTDKRKAAADGEDLLSPIVQKHAESIAMILSRVP